MMTRRGAKSDKASKTASRDSERAASTTSETKAPEHKTAESKAAEANSADGKPAKPNYSDIFSDWICDIAEIEPALPAYTRWLQN